jgi:putative methionine-R-sulfoxide reductase with GAF domain
VERNRSEDYARLFGLRSITDGGFLALRGITFDGSLAAVLALYEPKKFFGTRTAERFAPALALFDLSFNRFYERDARGDAVRTLEEVTQRVHGDYVRRLTQLEEELSRARAAERASTGPARAVAAERAVAQATEEARRATRAAQSLEEQLIAAVGQLEQAHVELHRRSDALRQKTRTLYLLERMLTVYDENRDDPRALADGLLALVGEDLQAQRCSFMLVAPDGEMLYLAAARGLSPEILEGVRARIGEGVAGRVAQSRQTLLVQDVSEAKHHPLLQDQFFTTGSFISFPLVLHGVLYGVVNVTNRARQGIYAEEDVERVAQARLPERLFETIDVR